MKYFIIAVYDKRLGFYLKPMITNVEAEAMRGFADSLITADHPFSACPQDYQLHQLCVFEVGGEFKPETILLLDGEQWLKESKERAKNAD